MFEPKRRRKKTYIFPLILIIIFLGANVAGYMMARDHMDSAVEPSRMPITEGLPYAMTFRILLPTFALTAPFEVAGYTLIGAYPKDLTLHYKHILSGGQMHVRIGYGVYSDTMVQTARLPEWLLVREGMNGALVREIFARGSRSDGISINPWQSIREGLAARLRADRISRISPSGLNKVFVEGDSTKGQVWRVYEHANGNLALIEGSIFNGEDITNISMEFEGVAKGDEVLVNTFANALVFGEQDPAKNAGMADSCVSDRKDEVEAAWETPCRQTHLVAMLVSDYKPFQNARSLYGEYLGMNSKEGVTALYNYLKENYEGEDLKKFIAVMEKGSPWLKPEKPSEK